MSVNMEMLDFSSYPMNPKNSYNFSIHIDFPMNSHKLKEFRISKGVSSAKEMIGLDVS